MSHKDFELFRMNFLAGISGGISSSYHALKQRPWVLWRLSMLKDSPWETDGGKQHKS